MCLCVYCLFVLLWWCCYGSSSSGGGGGGGGGGGVCLRPYWNLCGSNAFKFHNTLLDAGLMHMD